jgi:hypothetical protein
MAVLVAVQAVAQAQHHQLRVTATLPPQVQFKVLMAASTRQTVIMHALQAVAAVLVLWVVTQYKTQAPVLVAQAQQAASLVQA